MFKKFYYLIAFIVITVIAVFHVGLSSVKNSYRDMKVANIEVLANIEREDCPKIGGEACSVSTSYFFEFYYYYSDQEYWDNKGYIIDVYCGDCYEAVLIPIKNGCC